MFPESNLRYAFWNFVFARALDERYGLDVRPQSEVLDNLEMNLDVAQITAMGSSVGLPDVPDLTDRKQARTYLTIQEALTAFLIDSMAKNNFPYPYDVWPRMIVLVMADIHSKPGYWLLIKEHGFVYVGETSRREVFEHRMTVSDDWSWVHRDFFDLVRNAHRGTEPQ